MFYPYLIQSEDEYRRHYRQSVEDPEGFWSGVASHFHWRKKWDQVLNWNFEEPRVEWFVNGKLNITENCLDRHIKEGNGDVPALIWEPNDPKEPHRVLTYRDLLQQVNLFAEVLRIQGVRKGDRICIYMGMIPELAVAILAAARIGAVHSVIFGGFSAQSIADRVDDAGAEYIVTCDGAHRGSKEIPLKPVIDEAFAHCREVKKVIVFQRTGAEVFMKPGRDVWWHDEMRKVEYSGQMQVDAEEMDAEDMLFILYTSGSTGKPKGVVHTCGGYMVWAAYTFVNVFQYQSGEIHFCTADIGWITGHSYILYGPLCAGASSLMYEGVPTWPDAGRLWDIVKKHKVNILYTAPTAIRSLMSFGLEPIKDKDFSSLRMLGSVGEPINEEAWRWFYENIGQSNIPIVDTWWQTETGGIMISNLAGVTPHRPGWATLPLPGVQPVLLDDHGREVLSKDEDGLYKGNLCIKAPWPGILRTTYGDHERCRLNYFERFAGMYFTGDGAMRDEHGNFRITGRVDDVLNVSGHRIGTAELENAINMHHAVVESAVVGYPHDVKGQGIYAYVICADVVEDHHARRQEISVTVSKMIGSIARPDKIQFVQGLPKTRSGKIMRRILRKIAEGETDNVGDTTTLLDPLIVEEIRLNRIF
ncbi:MAG: acetate--CoA ligase [Saprospiraceae bacterium]|nr:acetate--CoA ligase [Saprospiraceae bacterium]HMW40572.1 acetate--CoA ligase [Saprospiraceae bacterium]HMZ40450.1 acetate--CoA ligase [Saprospiraceae bacterium]HNA64034.1 acetate--CoA ligase [Saprospiraceae bacterium]HNB30731.1 acetate--CoA ligase [Saprospiraceae bacterium]